MTRDNFRQATVTKHVASVTRIDHRTSLIDTIVVRSGVCDVSRWWAAINCKRSLIKVNAYMLYIGNYMGVTSKSQLNAPATLATIHSQSHDCGYLDQTESCVQWMVMRS